MARTAGSFLLTLFAAMAVMAASPATGRADQPEIAPREASADVADPPASAEPRDITRSTAAETEAAAHAAAADAEDAAAKTEASAEAAAADTAADAATREIEAEAEAAAAEAAAREAQRKKAECQKYTGSRLKPRACK